MDDDVDLSTSYTKESRNRVRGTNDNCNSSPNLSEASISPENKQTSLSPALPPKLPPCRSNSLEDIRNVKQDGNEAVGKGKSRRRRRTTLPKRRFSDLHLHLLLCPTKSTFCGNGSGSDDTPLTATTHRAHRSLPESPSELDEMSSFCFDFLDKNSKDKVGIKFMLYTTQI